MFQLRQPNTVDLRNFIQDRAPLPFNYPETGWTRTDRRPAGYRTHSHQAQLGVGQDIFERARKAMTDWKMFTLDWTKLCWPYKKIAAGSTVAVVALHFGIWSVNAARIVYAIDEPRLFAFAYGTLHDHAARGEERFQISWKEDDTVWYEIGSFSRPNHWLCYAGYPLMRKLQRQFLSDSASAMLAAVSGTAKDESVGLGVDL